MVCVIRAAIVAAGRERGAPGERQGPGGPRWLWCSSHSQSSPLPPPPIPRSPGEGEQQPGYGYRTLEWHLTVCRVLAHPFPPG